MLRRLLGMDKAGAVTLASDETDPLRSRNVLKGPGVKVCVKLGLRGPIGKGGLTLRLPLDDLWPERDGFGLGV